MYDLNNHGFKDRVSSWACGPGVSVDFCRDGESHPCTGDGKRSAAGPIKSKMIGDQDNLTVVHMYCYDEEN